MNNLLFTLEVLDDLHCKIERFAHAYTAKASTSIPYSTRKCPIFKRKKVDASKYVTTKIQNLSIIQLAPSKKDIPPRKFGK